MEGKILSREGHEGNEEAEEREEKRLPFLDY